MTGFSVKPDALDNYAKVLGAPDSDASLDEKYLIEGNKYNDEHVKLDPGQGGVFFQAVVGQSNRVHDQISNDNAVICTKLIESAHGLTDSSAEYRKHDQAAATKIDKTYRPEGAKAGLPSVDDSAPLGDPASALTEPAEDGPISDLSQQIIDTGSWTSLSDVTLKIIKMCGEVIGVDLDLMGLVKDKLAGDFGAIAKVRSAIENLGKFDQISATNIAEGADIMLKSWNGNAANAAKGYFAELHEGIDGRREALENTARKYTEILVSIQEFGAAIEGLITGLIDKALSAEAAVAAAGCLQEIPVVDVLVDLLGAERVMEVAHAAEDVIEKWNWAVTAGEGATSILAGAMGLVDVLTGYDVSAKLPSIGYHNDSQGPAPSTDEPQDPRGHQPS